MGFKVRTKRKIDVYHTFVAGTNTYDLGQQHIVPGTIVITQIAKDGSSYENVSWSDDGEGKIKDNGGAVIGTINYSNGEFELTNSTYKDAANAGKIKGVYFKYYDTINESGDTGEFIAKIKDDSGNELCDGTIMPGTLYISRDHNDKEVKWSDDGQGNIVNIETGETEGSVDYDSGKITVIGAAADNHADSNSQLKLTYVDMGKLDSATETSASSGIYETGVKVTPGTFKIYKYYENGTTKSNTSVWSDDGNGKIYDEDGNQKGTIDYTSGEVTLESDNSSQTGKIDFYYVPNGNTNVKASDMQNVQSSNINFSNVTSRTLNDGAIQTAIGMNFKNLSQLESDFIFYAQQNGSSRGNLLTLSVTDDGVIKATYTNGKIKDVARLAVATFKDKEILVRKGDSLFLPNQQTSTPIIVPGGIISKIRSGMLEMSNVDISQEFINLITAQRAYQASAKTITTSDQILQTTMDIKR